jgi:hypothetical protein
MRYRFSMTRTPMGNWKPTLWECLARASGHRTIPRAASVSQNFRDASFHFSGFFRWTDGHKDHNHLFMNSTTGRATIAAGSVAPLEALPFEFRSRTSLHEHMRTGLRSRWRGTSRDRQLRGAPGSQPIDEQRTVQIAVSGFKSHFLTYHDLS